MMVSANYNKIVYFARTNNIKILKFFVLIHINNHFFTSISNLSIILIVGHEVNLEFWFV